MVESLKVWFLSPEVAPYAKTGGLADMAGSLPGALRKLGMDVRVGLPFYRTVREKNLATERVFAGLEVPLGDKTLPCDVLLTQTEDGVPVYFFDREDFYGRPDLYSSSDGDYPDNLERFAYFNKAAFVFAEKTGFDCDIVHCHDWQTGLAPAFLKALFSEGPFFSQVASVFTIHNMGYQGLFTADHFPACGLPPREFCPGGVEYWGKISLLKAGIQYADAITTVSPTYSREIQTPEFGMGMEGLLNNRSGDLHGILNGVDYSGWDPATDPDIPAIYGVDDIKGKGICKAALIHEMGLDESFVDRPVFAVISRLTVQKGYDLLLQSIEDIVGLGAGLVVLAAGEQKYQRPLDELAQRYRGTMAVRIGFDEALAHRMMAGADMLLVPSRYEPCGLTQIYALKYGTVPIVRATGGLDDTIRRFNPISGEGTGFKFVRFDAKDFLGQIKVAIQTYHDSTSWEKVVRNGMISDFSWDGSAQEYVSLYRDSIERKRSIERGRGSVSDR
jgi:starch synthase